MNEYQQPVAKTPW